MGSRSPPLIVQQAMAKKHYDIERQGQADFFDNFHIDYQNDNSVLVDNTDGVYHGNILEFKLSISNTGKVLLQAIKYLSRMRIKGESVPARILLIDLNDTKVYVYHSADYLADIQKVYVGAASVGNDAFTRDVTPAAVYDYTNMVDAAEVQKLLINKVARDTDWYVPIDLDESCIVGWAERYYREIPNATKGDFLGDDTGKVRIVGEIREPKHFAGLINPYKGKTNEKFVYLMDCLNSRLAKKDLGAFYTPMPYARKAAELVQKAVERVPDGNDYIILDRCAGGGNLESALIGLFDRNGDELISHCIVSTYEYYEYKVLLERIGDKVRNVIPPTEANVVFANGNVSNADAMSEEYINNPLIKRYVDDPKCTIILFENPPYRDAVAGNNEKAGKKIGGSYIFNALKNDLPNLPNRNISTARNLLNQFIWSKKYYLRFATDSYVLFCPIIGWKSLGLLELTCAQAYVFNRKYFHASESAIMCALWINIPHHEETIEAKAINLDEHGHYGKAATLTLKQAHSTFLKYQNTVADIKDDVPGAVYCEGDGTEVQGRHCAGQSYWNANIIGYLNATGNTIDPKHVSLLRSTYFGIRGQYLRKDDFLTKLPLFVAKVYPRDKWYEKAEGCIWFTTADGGDAYTHDPVFLKHCLIYTCLSNQNKCLSFTGSDGRYYRNELCFDTTHGDTCASADLEKYAATHGTALDDTDKVLLELWDLILEEAKKTKNYDPALTYGVYQITKELNTFHVEGSGKSKKKIYDYPGLNGYLRTLRHMLKAYYKLHITAKMFKYQLLK